jgi:hypothetical protein
VLAESCLPQICASNGQTNPQQQPEAGQPTDWLQSHTGLWVCLMGRAAHSIASVNSAERPLPATACRLQSMPHNIKLMHRHACHCGRSGNSTASVAPATWCISCQPGHTCVDLQDSALVIDAEQQPALVLLIRGTGLSYLQKRAVVPKLLVAKHSISDVQKHTRRVEFQG